MAKFDREHSLELLVNVHNVELETIEKLSDEKIQQLLVEKEKEQIKEYKDPNRLLFIKGLPKPKEYQPKTSTKAGWITFILILVTIFAIFISLLLFALLKK